VRAIWLIRAYVHFAQRMPVRSCAVAAAVSSVEKGRATKRDKLPSLYRTAAVLPLPRAGNAPTATPRRPAPPEGPRFFRAASHRSCELKTTPRTAANLAAMSRGQVSAVRVQRRRALCHCAGSSVSLFAGACSPDPRRLHSTAPRPRRRARSDRPRWSCSASCAPSGSTPPRAAAAC